MKPVFFLLSLTLALLVAVPSPAAPSKGIDNTNVAARKLLDRLKKKKSQALATPLLDFTLSPPNPVQNQNVNVFITPNASFGGRRISLDAKLNGQEINLEAPTTNFWNLPLGLMTESRSHTLEVTKYIENTQDNTDIRQSISQLDSQINSLTNQINAERDAARRATLQANRAEKIGLKTELIEQLKKLRVKVGTQSFAFKVGPNTGDATLPGIVSLTPSSGDVHGGTVVRVNGNNFTSAVTVKLGGVTVANPVFVNSNTIDFTTPDFGTSVGAKDLELRFSSAQGIVNTIREQAYLAIPVSPPAPPVNTKPVAVAGGSQTVNLGTQIALDGSQSYDEQENEFSYAWQLISVPANSSHAVGESLPSVVDPTFTPDVHGTFVFRLVVQETETDDLFPSDPSIAVVKVYGAPAPFIPAILVKSGRSLMVKVDPNNPNEGHSSTFAITEDPEHGTASITSEGVITYTAEQAYVGADSLQVTVTDQAGLSGVAVASIQVESSNTPVPTAPAIVTTENTPATSQISPNPNNPSDSIAYSIIKNPMNGSATVNSAGLVSYTPNSAYIGSDSMRVVVAYNQEEFASVEISIQVNGNQAPVIGDLLKAIISRGEPYAVNLFSRSLITDPDGTIAEMSWNFGDGTSEKVNNPIAFIQHDYIHVGSYTATLTVKDNQGKVATKSFTVNVVDTDIPTAKFTADTFAGSAPLTINFDASAASDSDGNLTYWWNWGTPALDQDEIVTTPTISHTFTEPGEYQVRLAVVDPNDAVSISTVYVFVGVPAPLPFHPARASFQVAPARRVVLSNAFTFDGTSSFNPNVGGVVQDYNWSFGDYSLPDGGTATGDIANFTYSNIGNYYPWLTVAGPDGIFFEQATQEVTVVNTGFAPRALPVASVTQGIAPLTVQFTSESYDYDGTVDTHLWGFGADPHCGETDCSPVGQNIEYTFQDPGNYLVQLTAIDNDNNPYTNFVMVNVDSAAQAKKAKGKKKLLSANYDPVRERNRQAFTNLCGRGRGDSCYFLSKMYEEDGEEVIAQRLKTRACSLGYQEACASGNGSKWGKK